MTGKDAKDANGAGYEWEYAKKIDNRTTTQKILNFIYDPETHAFMGRTAKSWGGILLFYAIFYSILALLFAICMKVLLSTIDDRYPKWQLNDSLLGSNPGLGFRPRTKDPETASVIWYNFSDTANTESWVALLDEFFDVEYNKTNEGTNCSYTKPPGSGKYCKFPLDQFGPCSRSNKYGFIAGKPCIFVKLNRIYGWVPKPYADKFDTPVNDMPHDLQDLIEKTPADQRNNVWLSCGGQSPHDTENIGPIAYYPPTRAFPGYYYPYLHVTDYVSPLVAVQFQGLRRGIIINVECKAWALNIKHRATSQVREGSVHFELQVDDSMTPFYR